MTSENKPVAFLIRDLVGGTPELLFEGIIDATARQGQPLVVFRGGMLGKDPGSLIYDLVNDRYQGVITWASSDADDFTKNYYARYGNLPVVTLTLQIPPYPVVTTDSYAGVRAATEHLIEVHRRRQIAFIRGPENHSSAKERYKAYVDVLGERGIAVDERRVSPFCNWDKRYGAEMVALFLDERRLAPGKDVDAIVCVNDNIALGALEELQRRGVRVPEEIAITGCNDTVEARSATPPITSVSFPGREQVAQALDLLNQRVAGKSVPEQTMLPARLAIGQSCGCSSHSVDVALSGLVSMGQKFGLLDRGAALVRRLGLSGDAATIAAMRDALTGGTGDDTQVKTEADVRTQVAEKMLAAFRAELRGEGYGTFAAALNEGIRLFAAEKIPVEKLQDYISVIRRQSLPTLRRGSMRVRAEDIWGQGRVMLSETASRLRDAANLEAMGRERSLGKLGARLVTTHDVASIMKILQQDLPKLGIPEFHLAVYEQEAGWNRKSIPRQLRVLTAFNARGEMKLEGSQARMAVGDFIPGIIARHSARQPLMVLPLHFNDTQIGLAVFGIGPRDGNMYDTIKVQLSSALFGTLLRQTIKETMQAMEEKVAEVSGSSAQINQRVQGGSSAMTQVAASIHEISGNIREVLQVIADAVRLSTSASSEITVLNQQSQEINTILGIISGIAKRTNLLALNASIEAARAGEAGRGFAIVADEVKSLAMTTASSSANIGDMIGKVQENTQLVFSSIASINDIMTRVEALSQQISAAIAEQETSTGEISSALSEAAHGTKLIAEVLAEVDAIGKGAASI